MTYCRSTSAEADEPGDQLLTAACHDLGQITGPLSYTVISLSSNATLIDRLDDLSLAGNYALLVLLRQPQHMHRKVPHTTAWDAIANALDAGAAVLDATADELHLLLAKHGKRSRRPGA